MAETDYAELARSKGWEIYTTYLYDDEDVEGWRWVSPDGEEHDEIGPHDEPPSVSDHIKEILIGS